MSNNRINTVLEFWFGTLKEETDLAKDFSPLWFKKSNETDQKIQKEFAEDIQKASQGEYNEWNETAKGSLAYILLFDQFTRNIYRNKPEAFSFDHLAQKACLNGIEKGLDKQLYPIERVFYYLPLEHGESHELQKLSISKFESLRDEAPIEVRKNMEAFLDYAYKHKSIIDQFGRYPHRNKILNRNSTSEEVEFLKTPGSSF